MRGFFAEPAQSMFNRIEPSVAERSFEASCMDLMNLSPHAALQAFLQRHDRLIEVTAKQSGRTPACARGCAYCCHLKVVADAVEIFAMVDHVNSEFSRAQIEQVMQAARRNVDQASRLSHEAQATINQRCPLLLDEACAIYPVRSLKCRNYHSLDNASCRASFEHPHDLTILNDSIPDLYVAATGSSEGFLAALHAQGYDDRIYDLNGAFIEAMESGDCRRRYERKRRAFTRAKFNNA